MPKTTTGAAPSDLHTPPPPSTARHGTVLMYAARQHRRCRPPLPLEGRVLKLRCHARDSRWDSLPSLQPCATCMQGARAVPLARCETSLHVAFVLLQCPPGPPRTRISQAKGGSVLRTSDGTARLPGWQPRQSAHPACMLIPPACCCHFHNRRHVHTHTACTELVSGKTVVLPPVYTTELVRV